MTKTRSPGQPHPSKCPFPNIQLLVNRHAVNSKKSDSINFTLTLLSRLWLMTRREACGLILCIMTDHRPTVSAIKQTGNGTGLSWSRWCMLLIRPAHIDVGTMYQLNTTISFTLTIIVGSEHSKYDPMSCY